MYSTFIIYRVKYCSRPWPHRTHDRPCLGKTGFFYFPAIRIHKMAELIKLELKKKKCLSLPCAYKTYNSNINSLNLLLRLQAVIVSLWYCNDVNINMYVLCMYVCIFIYNFFFFNRPARVGSLSASLYYLILLSRWKCRTYWIVLLLKLTEKRILALKDSDFEKHVLVSKNFKSLSCVIFFFS